jgi:putative DNA methylase
VGSGGFSPGSLYYDNSGYAALSDFFYIWLRRPIGDIHPEIFQTVLVPKSAELIASAEAFNGNKAKAKHHFESGFKQAFSALKAKMDLNRPGFVRGSNS